MSTRWIESRSRPAWGSSAGRRLRAGAALACCALGVPAAAEAPLTEALEAAGLRDADTRLPIDASTDDRFRLAIVDSVLAAPLELPALARRLARLAGKEAPGSLVRAAAASLLAQKDAVPEPVTIPSAFPPGLSAPARSALEGALSAAGAPAAERRLLLSLLGAIDAALEKTPSLPPPDLLARALERLESDETAGEKDPFELRSDERRAIASGDSFYARVDPTRVPRRLSAHIPLLDALAEIVRDPPDRAALDTFRPLRVETPLGAIVVGTPRDDAHAGGALLLVDPGGDDRYDGMPGGCGLGERPIAVLVDFAGDDVYVGDAPGALAAGIGGAGLLLDLGGDDTYRGGDAAIAVGVLGLGVLWDTAGDDVYDAGSFSCGAGFLGAGVLADDAGHDVYRSVAYGQGCGFVGGLGALCDASGGDRYLARPRVADVIRYEDHHLTFLQGAGLGSRPDRSGGIGLLVDGGGNDVYDSDIYGQGTAYWFSLGVLVDRDGHDTYKSYQYAQGSGVHLAAAILLDEAGEDLYSARGVSQGCGHDLAVGMLVDRAGNDGFVSFDLSQGAGNANGIGVLLDDAGEDAYVVRRRSNSMGYGNPRRGTGSIGIFVDARGEDVYPFGIRNGSLFFGAPVGIGLDRPGAMGEGETWPDDPKVAFEERAYTDEELFVLASTAPPKFSRLRLRALELLAARGDAAMPVLLSHLTTRIARERHGLKDVFVRIGAPGVPFLAAALDTAGARGRRQAAWTLGHVASPASLSPLVPLLDDPDPSIRTAGAMAIARVVRGDSVAAEGAPIERLARLLDDPDPNARRASAFALGASRDERAVPALSRALGDPFFAVRLSAIDGLARMGLPGAEAAADVAADPTGGDFRPRAPALEVLARVAPAHRTRVSEHLVAALERAPDSVEDWTIAERVALARLVAGLDGEAGVAALFERLANDPDWRVPAALAGDGS